MPVSSEESSSGFLILSCSLSNWSVQVQVCTYRPSVSATWLGKGCPVCWQQRFLPLLQLVERFCLDRRPPTWLPFWPSGWHLKGSAFVSSLLPIFERHFFPTVCSLLATAGKKSSLLWLPFALARRKSGTASLSKVATHLVPLLDASHF